MHPFAIQQVQHPELRRLVRGLGRPQRFFRLRNQDLLEEINLVAKRLQPNNGVPHLELHRVPRRRVTVALRHELLTGLLQRRAILARPERNRQSQGNGEWVLAVIRRRHELAGRIAPSENILVTHAHREVRPGGVSRQRHRPLAAFDESRTGMELRPIAITQIVQSLEIEFDGRQRSGSDRRNWCLGCSIAQRIEARGQRGPLLTQHLHPIDDLRDLRLEPDHTLLQTLTGRKPCLRQLLVVLEEGLLLLGCQERGVDVRQVVVRPLDAGDDVTLRGHILVILGHGRLDGHPLPESECAKPRERLRVHEGVELRPNPGFDTSDCLGERKHRVGQRVRLRYGLKRAAIPCKGLTDAGVTIDGFVDVGTKISLGPVEPRPG